MIKDFFKKIPKESISLMEDISDSSFLLKNLQIGIELNYQEHIQGFPDRHVLDPLRGVYALVEPQLRNKHMDPGYKAAAILILISVAGGLITITPFGYKCNNGFIDSFGTMYESRNPILENLQIMAQEYIWDDYFIDKAIGYFEHCDTPNKHDNLAGFHKLLRMALMNSVHDNSQDECMMLNILSDIMRALSIKLIETAQSTFQPTSWDAEKWLKKFMPIWDSRNKYEQHKFRSSYYKKHIELVEQGCYISQSGKEVKIPWDAYNMMHNSKMYCDEMTVSVPENIFDTNIEIWQMDCLDAAKKVQCMDDGKTAVLNLANRQNPGGGVFTGSGAQEESCFLRSNYFTALYPFAKYAYQYDLPKSKMQYPLDRNFGGMWSEGVTVFRGRELEGYPLLDEPWKTNFIAVAGLNRPPLVEEDGELVLREDMVQATLNKLRTIFNIAIDNQVTNLVLGALGCGAFRNPSKHIATLFKQVLNEPEYKGRFHHVVFAILNQDLCEIFSACFSSGE